MEKELENPNFQVNKILENQYHSMFLKFDADLLESLTLA